MALNKGKSFEKSFEQNWAKSFPNSFILRLPDQQSGYFGTSQNICDFICFNNGKLFLIECKSIKGNTFPLSNLTQYDKLIRYNNIDSVYPCVVIWFYEHDKIVFVPIDTISMLKQDNKKSVNIKMLNDNNYNIIDIPSTKKRVYLDSDYSIIDEVLK